MIKFEVYVETCASGSFRYISITKFPLFFSELLEVVKMEFPDISFEEIQIVGKPNPESRLPILLPSIQLGRHIPHKE